MIASSLQRRLLAALLTLLFSAPAWAALVADGNSVVDTATGLEWLRLDVTLGLSPDAADATYAGYTLATSDQVAELFTHAGFSDLVAGAQTVDGPAAQLLIGVLGCTASAGICAGVNAYARGFATNSTGASLFVSPSFRIAQAPANSGDAVVLSLASNNPNQSVADRGVFLVRAVPNHVPVVGPVGSLVLVVGFLGLAGLVLWRGAHGLAAPRGPTGRT